jgi:hypothetical protein
MNSEFNNCIPIEGLTVVADRYCGENLILIIIYVVYKYKKIYC